MSLQPSSSNTPIITNYTPRGRPVLATLGVLLVIGGVIMWVLSSQGVVSIPGLSTITSAVSSLGGGATTSGPAPTGTAPANFTTYRDPSHRFALYVSQDWQSGTSSLTVDGQSVPATVFAPTATTLPNWRLAFLGSALPSDSLTALKSVSAILTADGDKDITPLNGPQTVEVGTAEWSRIDLSAQTAKGAAIHVVTFTRPLTNGAALIMEESPTLTFTTTEKQDYTPMLDSLTLAG